MKQNSATLVMIVCFFPAISFSQSWQFVGPDSASWQSVIQMDVQFRQNAPARIGIGTTKGVAVNFGGGWKYPLRNFNGQPIAEDIYYRTFYFSPWNDSVGFVGEDRIEPGFGERGSTGGTVRNVFSTYWSVAEHGGGGWVGHSPSLAFAFSPQRTGVVYSWIVSFSKSTSNGNSWQNTPTNSYGCFFLCADDRKDSLLYAWQRPSSGNHGIYRSTNDGLLWNLVRLRPSPSFFPHPYSDFVARGDTLLHAVSRFPQSADSSSGIFISTDFGTTWNQPVRYINVQKLARDSNSGNQVFAAAQGGIYRSTTSGLTWQLYSDSLPSLKLVDIKKDSYSDTLYVATADVGIYKVFPRTTDVLASQSSPMYFSLHQNFPNPFNPTTNVSYDIPVNSHVKLVIFNLIGQQVQELYNGNRSSGSYTASFDASGLSSGMYFYRILAGNFVETRKMLLVR